jgi:uncharacterized protein YfeS
VLKGAPLVVALAFVQVKVVAEIFAALKDVSFVDDFLDGARISEYMVDKSE